MDSAPQRWGKLGRSSLETSSRRPICAFVSLKSKVPRVSSSCACVRTAKIGEVVPGFRRFQFMATWVALRPISLAIALTSREIAAFLSFQSPSTAFGRKVSTPPMASRCAARSAAPPRGPLMSSWAAAGVRWSYLPVSMPWARGPQWHMPSSSSRHIGTRSRSAVRSTRLYWVWTAMNGDQPRRVAMVFACEIFHAGVSLTAT
mmetsp:Transcript_111301/g.315074  ORF Transcript_111301/g.315074 Transcript_111301/m.315074 type:complete len:203 (+) Transcript_111301:167-775(+)